MATVEIAFGDPVEKSGGPLDFAYPVSSQVITSSASNQTSTAAATGTGQTVVIGSSGGAVKISIGAAPNATSDTHVRIIKDGETRAFGGVVSGHKVAVTDL